MAASSPNLRSNGHHQSSGEVHAEIDRIRDDMDHTLGEIGDYLHPKHLFDYVVDSVRSGSAGSSKQSLREFADRGAQMLKRHPGPAMLLGGAALWYLMEQQQDDDQPRRRAARRRPRSASYGAWEEQYDWSASPEDEQTWSERASQALAQVRATIGDAGIAAKDKVKSVANHMIGVSGKSRAEIHRQWAELREHAGSYVDARTGEPYGDDYGEESSGTPRCQSALEACACISDDQTADESWSSKAQDAVASIASALKNTGASAKEQLRSIGRGLSDMTASTSQGASRAASNSRQAMSQGWDSASRGVSSAAESARHGARHLGDAVSNGLSQGRDQLQQTVHQQPLAVGAACLGLGLLAGLLAPTTRRENELMGDAADRLKDQAREAGEDVIQRGKQVASAAANAGEKEARRQGFAADDAGAAPTIGQSKADHTAKPNARRP